MNTFTEKQLNGNNLVEGLIKKAWEDDSFKNNLIINPAETISDFLGKEITLKDDRRIIVEDQTDSSKIFFNIPSERNFDEMELNEEQLELVSGGATPILCGIVAGYLVVDVIDYFKNK